MTRLNSDLGKKANLRLIKSTFNHIKNPQYSTFLFESELLKWFLVFLVVETWSIPKYENNCYGNSFLCWHNWTLAWKWGWLNSWHRFFQSCAQRNWRKFTVSIIPPLVPYRVLIRKKRLIVFILLRFLHIVKSFEFTIFLRKWSIH